MQKQIVGARYAMNNLFKGKPEGWYPNEAEIGAFLETLPPSYRHPALDALVTKWYRVSATHRAPKGSMF